MFDYRAYIVGTDRRLKSAEAIIAADDATALRIAHTLIGGHDLELWQLDRRIGVLHPKDSSPPE